MARERDIESYLVEKVAAYGGMTRKVKWIGRRGAPDRVVFFPEMRRPGGKTVPAEVIWVELKAPGKKPEPLQDLEHKRLVEMGQRVEVVDSFEAVDELF